MRKPPKPPPPKAKPFPARNVSHFHFGERYFAIRERISNVLNGIKALAQETGADLTDSTASQSIEHQLESPLVFLVAGGINAGKSTLLNSLFGCDLCPVNNLPETDRVIRYQFGDPSRGTPSSPTFQESYRTLPFLRDFTLIDTPGINSQAFDTEEITSSIIPLTDLILIVFPVTNPWEASTWNFISSLPTECHNRIVLIIQQADLREPEDLKVISEHVADLSLKRIGTIPPTFPVSAKSSFDTDLSALENFISHHICNSPKRRDILQSAHKHAFKELRTIEDHVETQSRTLVNQNHFLNCLEEEIESMRESLVARVPHHLKNITSIFELEALVVSKSLCRKLGIFRSLIRVFIGDRTGNITENLLTNRFRTVVETIAESDGADVVTACRKHWKDIDARVQESIGTSIGETVSIDETLEHARNRFVERIGRAAQISIGNLSMRKDLERELRKRNVALKSFTATTLILIIIAATLGILGFHLPPLIFCAVALLFSLTGTIIAFITKNRVTRDFRDSLLNTCTSFAETLRSDYEDALRSFFQEYTSCLSAIHKHLAHEKIAIEPKLNQWQKLFLTLKAIEQDLS